MAITAFLDALIAAVGILAVAFCAPAACIFFLNYRKRRSRAKFRSPLGIEMLRGPGYSLREQIDDANVDIALDIAFLSVLPLVILCMCLVAIPEGSGAIPTRATYVVCGTLAIAALIRNLWRKAERRDNLRAGYDAELAVGQELDKLMREGAFVFHDVPAHQFNIDHVVISERGVFAIETKGYSKDRERKGRSTARVKLENDRLAFPRWTVDKPLEQATFQAAWLSKWLTSATGDRVVATPVLVLPGWYVERVGRNNVQVLSGGELYRLLDINSEGGLRSDAIKRITHQLDSRCRDVTPLFSKDEPVRVIGGDRISGP